MKLEDRLKRLFADLEAETGAIEPSDVDLAAFEAGVASEAQKALVQAHLKQNPGCLDEIRKSMSAWRGPEGERRLEEFRQRVFDSLPGWPASKDKQVEGGGWSQEFVQGWKKFCAGIEIWLDSLHPVGGMCLSSPPRTVDEQTASGLYDFHLSEVEGGDVVFSVATRDPRFLMRKSDSECLKLGKENVILRPTGDGWMVGSRRIPAKDVESFLEALRSFRPDLPQQTC
jgi:hypothetical protein